LLRVREPQLGEGPRKSTFIKGSLGPRINTDDVDASGSVGPAGSGAIACQPCLRSNHLPAIMPWSKA
jgi:hypothetical protein